jgi:hypothetical protein
LSGFRYWVKSVRLAGTYVAVPSSLPLLSRNFSRNPSTASRPMPSGAITAAERPLCRVATYSPRAAPGSRST